MNLLQFSRFPAALWAKVVNRILAKCSFKECGEGLYLGLGVSITNPKQISIGSHVHICGPGSIMAITEHNGNRYNGTIDIGNNVYIGKNCHMISAARISIGNGSCLANNVHITDCGHEEGPPNVAVMKRGLCKVSKTIIGNNTFLGQNVNVLSGVTIGHNCCIGANAVVTKNIPDNSVAVGVPAKLIRKKPE